MRRNCMETAFLSIPNRGNCLRIVRIRPERLARLAIARTYHSCTPFHLYTTHWPDWPFNDLTTSECNIATNVIRFIMRRQGAYTTSSDTSTATSLVLTPRSSSLS